MIRGLGIKDPDPAKGQDFLNTARRLNSRVLPEINNSLKENRDIETFYIKY